jgi:hypothetical protein
VTLYLNNVEGNTIYATVGGTNCNMTTAGTDTCDLTSTLTDWASISGATVVLESGSNNKDHSVDMMYLEIDYTIVLDQRSRPGRADLHRLWIRRQRRHL